MYSTKLYPPIEVRFVLTSCFLTEPKRRHQLICGLKGRSVNYSLLRKCCSEVGFSDVRTERSGSHCSDSFRAGYFGGGMAGWRGWHELYSEDWTNTYAGQ